MHAGLCPLPPPPSHHWPVQLCCCSAIWSKMSQKPLTPHLPPEDSMLPLPGPPQPVLLPQTWTAVALLHMVRFVCLRICLPLWHTQLMETEPDCGKQEQGGSSSGSGTCCTTSCRASSVLTCRAHCRVTPCWHCHHHPPVHGLWWSSPETPILRKSSSVMAKRTELGSSLQFSLVWRAMSLVLQGNDLLEERAV